MNKELEETYKGMWSIRYRDYGYKQALTRSMARLEKKLDRRTRVVRMAEEMQEMRMSEDVVWMVLALAVGVYFLGQPW